jgi:hypothetical protein
MERNFKTQTHRNRKYRNNGKSYRKLLHLQDDPPDCIYVRLFQSPKLFCPGVRVHDALASLNTC